MRSNKLILYGRIQDSCMLVLTNIIPEIVLTLPTKGKTRLIAGRGWWLEAHLSSAPCQASCLPVRRDDRVWHLSSRWGLEDVCSHIPFPMCPLKCWLTRITFITGWLFKIKGHVSSLILQQTTTIYTCSKGCLIPWKFYERHWIFNNNLICHEDCCEGSSRRWFGGWCFPLAKQGRGSPS